jgi:hypothetical protein
VAHRTLSCVTSVSNYNLKKSLDNVIEEWKKRGWLKNRKKKHGRY